MEMDYLDGMSMDLELNAKERLKSVFPECFAEGKLDIDMLLNLCGEYITNDFEKYKFEWSGKSECFQIAQRRSTGTLRPKPDESVNFENTNNVYIKGDNLEVLKLLQTAYYRKVKMIYIDPPYNTGNDFVYEDDFSDPIEKYKEVTSQAIRSNPETMGRFHTAWLNMMWPRLRLAANLLRDDGVIFISIDDGEVYNLRKLCNEIFGEENFVSDISWQRTYSSRNDSTGIVVEVEHILVYSRQPNWSPNKLPRTKEMDSKYSSPDNDDRLWTSSSLSAPGAATHQGMVYAIQHPFTGEMMYPTMGRCWALGQDQILDNMRKWCNYKLKDIKDAKKRAEICGLSENDVRKDVKAIVLTDSLESSRQQAQAVLDRGKWPYFYFTDGGKGGIRRKTYLDEMGGRLPTNFWPFSEVGHTDEAKKELKALFDGDIPFDTPKPVRLIERILSIATEPNSIVFDFFSGSATTAHAVMKKNAEDGGCRNFIMVQLPELSQSANYRTLCDIGMERIRRAGAKILAEKAEKDKQLSLTDSEPIALDIGFKVFELDTSNLKAWDGTPVQPGYEQQILDRFNTMIDNMKPDRSDLDMVYEIMLKMGIPLTFPILPLDINNKKAYSIGKDNNDTECMLLICLAEGVTPDDIEEMTNYSPSKIVVSRRCMQDTTTMANAHYILQKYHIPLKLV